MEILKFSYEHKELLSFMTKVFACLLNILDFLNI